MLFVQGDDILPEFLEGINRSEWVTFYKNQLRAIVNEQSILVSVFDVKHTRSNHKPAGVSFWDAMAQQVANPYNDQSWETVVQVEFIRKYNLAINKRDNLPLGLINFYNEMLADKINKGVSIADVEVLNYMATCLECILVIVHVATNGLGYVVQKAFVGEGVCTKIGTYYLLVHVENSCYDSLSPRTYDDDIDDAKEAVHLEAIDEVVRRYLVEVDDTEEVAA